MEVESTPQSLRDSSPRKGAEEQAVYCGYVQNQIRTLSPGREPKSDFSTTAHCITVGTDMFKMQGTYFASLSRGGGSGMFLPETEGLNPHCIID
jgi:hypothetical protein